MTIERMTDTRHVGRTVAAAAEDVKGRVELYTQRQLSRLADRAQDLGRQANQRLARSTGRPLETWAVDARRYLKTRPLQVLAVTIALGYILGKLTRGKRPRR